MKKLIQTTLLVASLASSLTACGGSTNLASPASYAGYTQQPGAYSQNPYAQNNYTYQPPTQTAYQQPMAGQQLPAQSLAAQNNPATVRQAAAPTATRTTTAAPRTSTAARTTATKTPTKTTAKAPATAPRTVTRQAAAPKPAATPESIAQDLLNKARDHWNQIQTFSIQADAYEKNEKGVTNLSLTLNFQKPGTTKLEVVKHTNSLYVGAKLFYESGQGKLTGRPGGALSFMKLTVPLTDDRVTSRRGYPLDRVDTLAIVNRLINSGLKPKILGKTNVNGRDLAILEFTGACDFDPAITRELIGIDMQDHFVRLHEMYAGPELVYSLKLQSVTFNPALAAADLSV